MGALAFVWEQRGATCKAGKAASIGRFRISIYISLIVSICAYTISRILEMVTEIRGMGMEVCTTLGMLSPDQARRLKEAGLTGDSKKMSCLSKRYSQNSAAYNHNLDTSREFYPKVITTRSYDERLETISAVQAAGISVCSGGILGLGESDDDRVGLIWEVGKYAQRCIDLSTREVLIMHPIECQSILSPFP
jgi:biotin synthase-like enzyme